MDDILHLHRRRLSTSHFYNMFIFNKLLKYCRTCNRQNLFSWICEKKPTYLYSPKDSDWDWRTDIRITFTTYTPIFLYMTISTEASTCEVGTQDLYVKPPPKLCSLFFPPAVTLPSLTPVSKAHDPISSFFAGPVGEMSKSKISMGSPMVVHALGMSTIPATWPWMGAHDRSR